MPRWIAVSCLAASCLAMVALVPALGQDHVSAAGHHQQGMTLYRAHDPEGAIRELARAVEIDPHYAEAWNDLGVIQRQRGNVKTAIDSFRHAVREKSQFASAEYNLALALEAVHEVAGAVEHARRVTTLAPRMAQG